MTDLTRKRGDTYADEWAIISETTGQPIDITDHTFKLTVDPSEEPDTDSENLFQLTGVLTDPTNGIVEFAPSAAQADHVGSYFYDVQMTDPAGRLRTIDKGAYVFTQDITK